MVNNSTNITKTNSIRFADIGSIVDHHYLEVVVIRFVDIGGIVDHHCLEVVVIRFVDIGGIVDHQIPPISTKRITTSSKQ
jgi:hypothetical protein